ncbi:MAG TPA: transposase [Sedimenticola sp.]|nr:transposase [Sedimenticola sp.]
MGRRSEIPDRALAQRILKRKIRCSPELQQLHRLHCVLLVGEGFSCKDVAYWFGNSPRTLERWVHRFRKSGINGLTGEQRAGRPTILKRNQLRILQEDIDKGPDAFNYDQGQWDGKLLAAHIQTRFGLTLSVRHCQRLLREFKLANSRASG